MATDQSLDALIELFIKRFPEFTDNQLARIEDAAYFEALDRESMNYVWEDDNDGA
jgi:hypothetical protein